MLPGYGRLYKNDEFVIILTRELCSKSLHDSLLCTGCNHTLPLRLAPLVPQPMGQRVYCGCRMEYFGASCGVGYPCTYHCGASMELTVLESRIRHPPVEVRQDIVRTRITTTTLSGLKAWIVLNGHLEPLNNLLQKRPSLGRVWELQNIEEPLSPLSKHLARNSALPETRGASSAECPA